MSQRPLIAGNWKMNLSGKEAEELASSVAALAKKHPTVDVAVAPPAIWLERVVRAAKDAPLQVWGQNAAEETKGAFTGETSFPMLLDAGAVGALLGHSERRHVFAETDASIATRAELGVVLNAQIILCVGETLNDRKEGRTMQVVREQLKHPLSTVPAALLTVAYEPVWAIGTGETASPEQVQAVHAEIRAILKQAYGDKSDAIRILYGGSVNPGNAQTLLALPEVQGVLVGGASLKTDDFSAIIAAATK